MKLTTTLKLQPSEEQRHCLYQTLIQANAACNAISELAWEAQAFGRSSMHRLTYNAIRAEFGLSAQLTIRCISKVVDAYKPDQKVKRCFRKLGAVAYDERILRFRTKEQTVSI